VAGSLSVGLISHVVVRGSRLVCGMECIAVDTGMGATGDAILSIDRSVTVRGQVLRSIHADQDSFPISPKELSIDLRDPSVRLCVVPLGSVESIRSIKQLDDKTRLLTSTDITNLIVAEVRDTCQAETETGSPIPSFPHSFANLIQD